MSQWNIQRNKYTANRLLTVFTILHDRYDQCRLDFDTPLSSIATLPQSPLPSRPHSWLSSTNSSYFTLASVHFLSSPYFSPTLFSLHLTPTFFFSSPPLLLYMPITCPYMCYIGLYCTISSYTGVGFRVYNFICPLNFPKFAYKGLVWNSLRGFRLSIWYLVRSP